MYKFLLSLRYLRTRYIALASVISVTLGVATMIIVNSVMSGFQNEMYNRLHGILSDIVVEANSLNGIADPYSLMEQIETVLGDDLEAMTPNVHIPAMLSFQFRNETITKQINLIGVDQETYAHVSDFGKYLLHPSNQKRLSFDLHEDGYDDRLGVSGWRHRRNRVAIERAYQEQMKRYEQSASVTEAPAALDVTSSEVPASDPFQNLPAEQQNFFDEMSSQHAGIVLGIALSSVQQRDENQKLVEYFLCRPGDDVRVSFLSAGTPPRLGHSVFTIVDFYESKMSEYDASFAFVPLRQIQELRGMVDHQNNVGAATAIQIKLAAGVNLEQAVQKLQASLHTDAVPLRVQSWKDLQGPLLAAVRMETTLLNILLFLIIAVAGFGILATFFMIVVEKTRDIGILKSLGASCQGVMSIFLAYGVSLGTVGSCAGMVLGLVFVAYINEIAKVLEKIRGQELFDPSVYYFQEIPTIVSPLTVAWIVTGAILIAVLASILPALRAARLHPVEALRYE
jgi:lipoprotein-releasing system permease protein